MKRRQYRIPRQYHINISNSFILFSSLHLFVWFDMPRRSILILTRQCFRKTTETIWIEISSSDRQRYIHRRSLRSLGNPPRTEKDRDLRIATLKVFTEEKLAALLHETSTVPPFTQYVVSHNQSTTDKSSLRSTSTVTSTSTKPRFSFRIMEERPTTQPVKRLPVSS